MASGMWHMPYITFLGSARRASRRGTTPPSGEPQRSAGMQPALPVAAALKVAFLVLSLLPQTGADLPVHCLRHQIQGEWDFFLGPAGAERSSCGHESPDHEERQPEVSLAEVHEQKRITP